MMNKAKIFSALTLGCCLCACAPQSTPSMMNTSRPQLTSETVMQQVPVKDVDDAYIQTLADHYSRYGAGGLKLSIGYDPASKSYTAMKAFNDLNNFKSRLTNLGVRNISADTVKSDGADPVLMVSFDAVKAETPSDCSTLPGIDTRQTTRFLGDYKFGCSVDTLTARQVYRPSDLQGNGHMDPADGRRITNSLEYYRAVPASKATKDLEVMGREQIQAQ